MGPIIQQALRILLPNAAVVYSSAAAYISTSFKNIFTSEDDNYIVDSTTHKDSYDEMKTAIKENKESISTQVSSISESIQTSTVEYNQAVRNLTKENTAPNVILSSVPTPNVFTAPQNSLIDEMVKSNSNTVSLDNIRNITLENQVQVLKEIVKQQSLTNELIKGQSMVQAQRFANEQKQTLYNEAIMHTLVENLPAVTLALSQLGTISNTLRNSMEINAVNSRSLVSVLDSSMAKLTADHITHPQEGYYAKTSASHITSPTTGYYAKSNESLDFSKLGDASLKDSDGVQIKPREVIAKRNAEMEIETREMNQSKVSEDVDFLEDFLQDLGNPLGILENLKDSMFKEIDTLNLSGDDKSFVLNSINSINLSSYEENINEN